MATDREISLEVALISVVKAAHKQGVDLKSLLDLAAEVVSSFPHEDPARDDRISSACAEISNAHTAVLTGVRVKA
ncbi:MULTISPECIES: hypothetical protein [Pseudomonas]|uniref:Uncharacterized protein n=1 Tax=Pseudomonas rhodesiae TaxID=76760 RepID=A0A8I1JF83_9PSED|nr:MULTISPECIES: hypothetical protein [Pseudomonas]MBI6600597.1 hypothetical protein [Pseudomonas sp. S4_EA_1b]MBI6625340.1 hypothetical protein [Pseudomonas rhodesiae]RZI28248.1 hypothetical protein EUX58_02070 [Pseudomonas sp. 770NI]